jgi:hypothetical protein
VVEDYHLAQINVGRLRAPIDDPQIAEFADALEEINAIADASPGFVWRLQTDDGNATGIQTTDDPLFLINMSVWETPDTLFDYVYRSEHVDFMRKRNDWFDRMHEPHMCLWWVPAGEVPTPKEGLRRLEQLRRDGPTPDSFSFRHRYRPPPGGAGP